MKKILLCFNNLIMTIALLFGVISCNTPNEKKVDSVQLINGIANDITAVSANNDSIFVGTSEGKIYQKNKIISVFSEFTSQLDKPAFINNLLVNESSFFVSTITSNWDIDHGGQLYKYDFTNSEPANKNFSHFHDFEGKIYSIFFSKNEQEIYVNIELEASRFEIYKSIINDEDGENDEEIEDFTFNSRSAILNNNHIYVTNRKEIHRYSLDNKQLEKLTVESLDSNIYFEFKNLIVDNDDMYIIGEERAEELGEITKNIIFKSTDGRIFEKTPIEVSWEIKTMIANNGTIYFGGKNPHLYQTTKKDNFATYNKKVEDDFTEINTLLYKENIIYLGSNDGKFYSIK